ncbi:MAG: glycine dehydrogenase (aminomethyl-transferring) [Bacteroidia bacterium]|nr:MAG: glycine dehydrogenase (aminomethyl-transferring) [Bacteroidia bacterium]
MLAHNFSPRHLGVNDDEIQQMIKTIGVESLDQLIDETIPSEIRLQKNLDLPEALSEPEYLNHIREIARKNKTFKSYIGLGFYNTYTPSVILRNIFENPGWYTAYTPYQAEIAQGRLEALLNYQTMVSDLTGLPIANASLLDEASAAVEAMMMFFNAREKNKQNALKFFVDEKCFPQTINTLKNRAISFGIELVVQNFNSVTLNDNFFGALVQYPNVDGEILDYTEFIQKAKQYHIPVAIATDLMALLLVKSPGEMGADCAFGNAQRFGVPLGYGGPHAAFFATTENFKRFIPGRIIGVSVDAQGKKALRMALQTREQHIKRERATSNICTAQALLAIMSGMYAVYHGPEGLKDIALNIHQNACSLKYHLEKLGYKVLNKLFFDTITFEADTSKIRSIAEQKCINFRYNKNGSISISLDETTTISDLKEILEIFAQVKNQKIAFEEKSINYIEHSPLLRTSEYLTHPVFNSYHTETEMMRYIKTLENKDISLVHSMISLGSCTMKLNAASELIPLSWPEFANIHPYVPDGQAEGYHFIINELEKYLCEITGFSGISFQPNSGAQGEYTGLLLIRSYHKDKGEGHRNVILIPSSAHGTNPASAAMAGFKIVVVKCDAKGNVDVEDLKSKVEQHKNDLAGLMITYPSTHGVFEERIKEITDIIHQNGGLVYMDGANMNAQVGLTNPAIIGADVCHLNLHKTFAIPHGGGGPGMGPVLVNDKLKPYLPKHPLSDEENTKNIYPVSASHYGSALILLITYGYIRMLGSKGLTNTTKIAILNANYLKDVLKDYYKILYTNHNNRCAHEFIIDCSTFKLQTDVEVVDIAKRLMDFGYHAPTVAFPVPNTLMIEPTESESKHELDRFADAMITIKREIENIQNGTYDKKNNPLKNAPHTAEMVVSEPWNYPYSREYAAFPRPWIKLSKVWPSVARIDNAYGDRNLICTCLPTSEYEMA